MPPYAINSARSVVSPGAKVLQDQLHDLITRLTLASDHIKNWNEADAATGAHSNTGSHNTTVHAESTSRFIALVHEVMDALQKVEATLKTNMELRQALQMIQVPFDLLELMDCTSINPDLYLRGLVTEATQQLVGLQRRKSALNLLSTTIENRLNSDDEERQKRQRLHKNNTIMSSTSVNNNNKRNLEGPAANVQSYDSVTVDQHQLRQQNNTDTETCANEEPATKKQRT